MKPTQSSIISSTYLNLYGKMAEQQSNASPSIFFLIFLYANFYKYEHLLANTYLFSLLPIALMLTLRFNLTFMTAQFLKLPNFYLASIVFLAHLVLGCNQKWKTYLFIFAIGNTLAWNPLSKSLFYLLSSALLCKEIFSHLPFRTLKDNQLYFTGFFAIGTYGAIHAFTIMSSVGIATYIRTITVTAAGLFAYRLFRGRVQGMMQSSTEQIRDVRVLAFYLATVRQGVRIEINKNSRIALHKQACNNAHCFCHNSAFNLDSTFFIRQLYEDAIIKHPHSTDTILSEHYVSLLLENGLIEKALYFLVKWDHSSHFSFMAKARCVGLVKRLLRNRDSSSPYQKQFGYALQYDELLGDLTLQVYEVLEAKLLFWHQIGKESPRMTTLQRVGRRIVDQMSHLNHFYGTVLKDYEKRLYCFEATILYATYLLATTNFKEYAEIIIKKVSKLLEDEKLTEDNISESYAVRIVVRRQGLYDRDEATHIEGLLAAKQRKDNGWSRLFQMVVDGASHNFCKLVKTDKQELVGRQLNSLLPNVYRPLHQQQISKIINFQDETLLQIQQQKLHKFASKLPIKVGEKSLAMCFISIKTMFSIEDGYAFISLVKKIKDTSVTALVDFNGRVSEKEGGFCQSVLAHSEVKKYLQNMKASWEESSEIKEERFSLMMNSVNFSISISSPYASYFASNPSFLGFELGPPLHAEIRAESSGNKSKNSSMIAHHKMVEGIKKFGRVFNQESEWATSSISSTTSINVISNFTEKNTVPQYRKIIAGFYLIATASFCANSLIYFAGGLPWDNTNILTNNPLNDTMNFMKLQHLSSNILLNFWDIQEYNANAGLNSTEISAYFSTKRSYLSSIDSLFKSKFMQFKGYLYSCMRFPSTVMVDSLEGRFDTQVSVSNASVIASSFAFQDQSMRLMELLINYMVDFNIMSKGFYSGSLLLPLTFNTPATNLLNGTSFDTVIDSAVDASLLTTEIMEIVLSLLICLLTVCLYCLLKARGSIHERIFDLFAEIQCKMVAREIKSLTYISNIVKDYAESNDILKLNTIDYEQNNIYAKRGSGASVANEMVIGLQEYDVQVGKQVQTIGKTIKKKKGNRSSAKGLKQAVSLREPLRRKRTGDLNLKGSESDPSLRINNKHAALYAIILFFLPFLIAQATITASLGSIVKQKKSSIIKLLDGYSNLELSFTLGKIYLRTGNVGLDAVDPASYLSGLVQGIPAYDMGNKYGYDSIYQNCEKNGSASKVVCSLNYSYLLLLGEFGTMLKQLLQNRYTTDLNYTSFVAANQTGLYNQILANISAKVFYLQSVDNQLESLIYNIADGIYLDLLTTSQDTATITLLVYGGAIFWWGVAVAVGSVVLLRMKGQYFKEVFMLTFLSAEMITTNKRVESFLESISKADSV